MNHIENFSFQIKRETCNSTMANDSAIDHGSERKQDFLTQKVHLLFKDYFKEKKLVNKYTVKITALL